MRLARYLIAIHPRYLLRALLIGTSSVCGLPLHLWERMRYGRRISQVMIDSPPVFIIGHWRSGTTHLHNLMSQDPTFGYVSTYQAMVPDFSLVGPQWLKSWLTRIFPMKRPMDNMLWPMDAPQEEEIPLAKMMPYSFYTQFLFPHKTLQIFDKYVLLHGASQRVVAEFKRKYYRLLQIATLQAGGKRLLLKNPVNTARIRLLLELFPNAKFVHIHRSPYDVFSSTRHLHQTLLQITTLQDIKERNPDDTILSLYDALMQRFFAERELIPDGNYAEVRFEDLEREPLKELSRVYKTLNLPGFMEAEQRFRAYIATQKTYRKNRFELSAEERARIEEHWAFAFSQLGYPLECH